MACACEHAGSGRLPLSPMRVAVVAQLSPQEAEDCVISVSDVVAFPGHQWSDSLGWHGRQVRLHGRVHISYDQGVTVCLARQGSLPARQQLCAWYKSVMGEVCDHTDVVVLSGGVCQGVCSLDIYTLELERL